MKLDISCFSFLSSNEYRVLTAIEMGMKNHEYLPVSLIAVIANLRKEGITSVLKKLLKNKLISHQNKKYDGYKLTYLGYDFLALRAFLKRGVLKSIGSQIGVGKESDIYICKDVDDNFLCLKIHRLGRISFRTIKNNRDYYGKKTFRNWLYLSKIAATKEYAYLKALYENDFPVPKPYDINRHMILMSYINAYPLSHVKLNNPFKVIDFLINTIIKFSKADIIHGDFNEFNILIDDDENVTIIDFPQIVSLHHENAKMYFERDLKCIINYFFKKYKIKIIEYPMYEDIISLENQKLQIEENKLSNNDHKMLLEVLQDDKSNYDSDYTQNSYKSSIDQVARSVEYESASVLHDDKEVQESCEKELSTKEEDHQNKKIKEKQTTEVDQTNVIFYDSNESFENEFKDPQEEENKKERTIKLEKREDVLGNSTESVLGDVGKKGSENVEDIELINGEIEQKIGNNVDEVNRAENKENINEQICEIEKVGDVKGDQKCCSNGVDKGEVNDEKDNKINNKTSKIKKLSNNDIISLSTNESSDTEYSSYSLNNFPEDQTTKLSDTWKPHIKKYTKEYVKSQIKYMYRKKKNKEKYKENLKTKNKKKVIYN